MEIRHWLVWACGAAGLLIGAPAPAQELHGYLTLVSDYVFRGVSQSDGSTTAQGGLDYRHPTGVFAGLFVARTEFPANYFGSNPGSIELVAYLGYGRGLRNDWSWDVAAFHYDYPDSTGFDYAYDELAANLHYREVFRLGATASDDAGAGGASGWTAEMELRQPLGKRYEISATLGRYEFGRGDWEDYLYWDVGFSAVVGAFTFDARFFDTDDGNAGFAGPRQTGSRLVGSVSLAF